jgi:DNA-binding NtrC family response regulator
VREGLFRDDLYYRLGVLPIELPPLRSYKGQIEVLANVFRDLACKKLEKSVTRISPEALAVLASYDYPGNVRELRNAIEHAVIMADGETIEPAHLPLSMARSMAKPAASKPHAKKTPTLASMREAWLAPLEARWLGDLLVESHGNVRAAAKRDDVTTRSPRGRSERARSC